MFIASRAFQRTSYPIHRYDSTHNHQNHSNIIIHTQSWSKDFIEQWWSLYSNNNHLVSTDYVSIAPLIVLYCCITVQASSYAKEYASQLWNVRLRDIRCECCWKWWTLHFKIMDFTLQNHGFYTRDDGLYAENNGCFTENGGFYTNNDWLLDNADFQGSYAVSPQNNF